MSTSNDIFAKTLSVLEQAFQVGDIATFDLVTCKVADEADQILRAHPNFDHIPVKEGDEVVGVLDRHDSSNGETVRARMFRLVESKLVSADMALGPFLPLMDAESFYRLVLRDSRISGIVTRSDVFKRPIRLFAFARVMHIEKLMAEIIQQNCPQDDDWLKYLAPGRQKGIKKERDRLKEERDDPPLIEFTHFGDKCSILEKTNFVDPTSLGQLLEIKKLRNQIAHVNDVADDSEHVADFLKRMSLTETWIDKLGRVRSPILSHLSCSD